MYELYKPRMIQFFSDKNITLDSIYDYEFIYAKRQGVNSLLDISKVTVDGANELIEAIT